jgi:hypothetical protein
MSAQLGQPPRLDAAALGTAFPALGIVRESVQELRANWGWFVALGAALMILGLGASPSRS